MNLREKGEAPVNAPVKRVVAPPCPPPKNKAGKKATEDVNESAEAFIRKFRQQLFRKEFQNILNSRAVDAVAYGFEKCKRMVIDKDALKSDFNSARLNLFDRICAISRQTSSTTSARASSVQDPSGSNAERDNPDSRVSPSNPTT
ncbi:hypothetical protein BUALT_Bualt07G0132800 [Buddleja alternifolia]|uniref:Uncharacterized protein n=1 Tax=Buddleja alternifolia TaxID=168488 RepID=A0AAV6XKZ8_9LAMI|nr:hypothetical protein BUALT_Bualt07G0132800 [Buddleja alternifolia]